MVWLVELRLRLWTRWETRALLPQMLPPQTSISTPSFPSLQAPSNPKPLARGSDNNLRYVLLSSEYNLFLCGLYQALAP